MMRSSATAQKGPAPMASRFNLSIGVTLLAGSLMVPSCGLDEGEEALLAEEAAVMESAAGGGGNRCKNVVCAPLDQCHVAGVCDKKTGLCSNPVKPNGSACN